MTTYLRHPLVWVWALLTAATIASWLTARDGGEAHHLNATVTVVVLTLAAVKAQLVMWHFMVVRRAPAWLRVTTNGWLLGLFALLFGCYFAAGG